MTHAIALALVRARSQGLDKDRTTCELTRRDGQDGRWSPRARVLARELATAASTTSVVDGGIILAMAVQDDLLGELVSLPQAAELLDLHRATVNEMVKTGRLHGYRLGPHWYVRRSEVELFKQHYRRPKNAPRRRAGQHAVYWTNHILRWLLVWETATSDELAAVIDLHIGNIRKYLVLAEQEGLTSRDHDGYWRLTDQGRTRARLLPPAGEATE